MKLKQVLSTLALPWQSTRIGWGRYLLHHPDCLGAMVLDEQKQVIFISDAHDPSSEKIKGDIVYYTNPKYYVQLNAERILLCEYNALSDFKKPNRTFLNFFKLCKELSQKEQEGTVAVYGHMFEDIDGLKKWEWIRIEWDEGYKFLSTFEKAVSEYNAAKESNDEARFNRAKVNLSYMTGSRNWLKTDKVILVGKLMDGTGFTWLTNATIFTEAELAPYASESYNNMVVCHCGFYWSVSWHLGYIGDNVASLHHAFTIHAEKCPNCKETLNLRYSD